MGRKLKQNTIRYPKQPEKITNKGKLVYPSHDEELYYKKMLEEEYYLKAEREFDDYRILQNLKEEGEI